MLIRHLNTALGHCADLRVDLARFGGDEFEALHRLGALVIRHAPATEQQKGPLDYPAWLARQAAIQARRDLVDEIRERAFARKGGMG